MKYTEWTAAEAGRLDVLVKRGAELSNARARMAILTGKVFVAEARVVDPGLAVAPGTKLRLDPAAPNPQRTEPLGVRLVHRDEHLLVVDKPAGLNSVPTPDAEEATALDAAQRLCKEGGRPKAVHRLDRETSGLLIFGRTSAAIRVLRQALDDHDVRRVYRCVVQGVPEPASGLISSMLVRDTGEGRRGSRPSTFRVRAVNSPEPGPMPGFGKLAITRYQTVLARNDRAALEVWLATGRTHQIRIHLAELGFPVLGERVYAKVPGAPRQALHAARLSFLHPVSGEPLVFQSPWPADLAEVAPRGVDW